MLSELTLTDFKAFHHVAIKLKPLTVLVGPNNSGKSSLLAAIRLLAQTLQSRDPSLPLLLDGAFGDFGTYRDLVYGNHRGRPFSLELGVLSGTIHNRLAVEYKYRTVRRQLVLRQSQLSADDEILITVNTSNDFSRYVITRLGEIAISGPSRSLISNLLEIRNFVPRLGFLPSRANRKSLEAIIEEETYGVLDDLIDQAALEMWRVLDTVDYIGAMRQAPERTYHQTGTASTKIGAYGENWAGLFALDAARLQTDRRVVPHVTDWLRSAGLAADVRLKYLSDRHYEFQLQHQTTEEYENLADVGQANSQIIPVLVGGYGLRPGSTYLVEEPEIHLHPKAQGQLGDFFLDLLQRNVAAIVETHSEYLILRLQQHIAAGRLRPEDVAFYYVYASGSKKLIQELTFDSEGRFDRPLDRGFFPERLEESRNLALIRKDRRTGNHAAAGN